MSTGMGDKHDHKDGGFTPSPFISTPPAAVNGRRKHHPQGGGAAVDSSDHTTVTVTTRQAVSRIGGACLMIIMLFGVAYSFVVKNNAETQHATLMEALGNVNASNQGVMLAATQPTVFDDYNQWVGDAPIREDVVGNSRNALQTALQTPGHTTQEIRPQDDNTMFARKILLATILCDSVQTTRTELQWRETPTRELDNLFPVCRDFLQDVEEYNQQATQWNTTVDTAMFGFQHGNIHQVFPVVKPQ